MSNAHPRRVWRHDSIFGDGPRQPLNRDERARYKFLLNAHHKAGRITRACRDIGLARFRGFAPREIDFSPEWLRVNH
jgi:hypothetical protein